MPIKITKSVVDATEPGSKDQILFDEEIKGFGLKTTPAGKKVFILKYTTLDGTQRKPTLGVYGSITLAQAREVALEMLAAVRAGNDPSQDRKAHRATPTLADVLDRYLAEYAAVYKKPRSYINDELYCRLHVRPRLGQRKITSICRGDIETLHRELIDSKVTANRIVAMLSKIFNLCETSWGLRTQHSNPCYGLKKYKETSKHRPLTDDELARLADVLIELENDPSLSENPRAIAAIRLLIFTGMRRNEVLHLRWTEVRLEAGIVRLEDSKTGSKVIALNSAAKEIIAAQQPMLGNPFVFPSPIKPLAALADIRHVWCRVRKRAGLTDVRLHDLRHNFAEKAAAGGLSLHAIGTLLGHRSAATTKRYADLLNSSAIAASEVVGTAISAAMTKKK